MKKTYINPKTEVIDFALEQHILQTSTKDTFIDNKNEVGAEESLTKVYEGRKNGIWD
jgi:hypothetical protein